MCEANCIVIIFMLLLLLLFTYQLRFILYKLNGDEEKYTKFQNRNSRKLMVQNQQSSNSAIQYTNAKFTPKETYEGRVNRLVIDNGGTYHCRTNESIWLTDKCTTIDKTHKFELYNGNWL